MADPLHQAAITSDAIGVMFDQIRPEPRIPDALGERHANGIGDALPEGTRGGLDAGGMTIFGMACRLRAELAELLDLADVHARRAREMQQRIEQH